LITVLWREGRLAWGPEHACCWSVAGPQGGTLYRTARRLDRSLDRMFPSPCLLSARSLSLLGVVDMLCMGRVEDRAVCRNQSR
jgi:hypothetical protein